LTSDCQQEILKALNQMLTDLHDWLRGLGVSEAEIIPQYISIVRENGIMAKVLSNLALNIIPLSRRVPVKPETFDRELARIRSGEFAAWLLSQPEPTPESLAELLDCFKNALPNLRQHLFQSAKLGPRHKRGGRPKELASPELRGEIREKIKNLRVSGSKLHDIFNRLARQHGVSTTAIKRIWAEGKRKNPK